MFNASVKYCHPNRKEGAVGKGGQNAFGRKNRCVPGAIIVVAMLIAATTLLLTGCITAAYILPYPDTVYVIHPDKLGGALSEEKLREMYTVSPNRDPDGWGALATMERNSQMTLMVKQTILAIERGNRLAYARSEAEQRKILNAHEEFFRSHVLFHGILLGVFLEATKPSWYLPEGIYILDDQGRKFLPVIAEELPERSYNPLVRPSKSGELYIGYPRLVFSKAVISAETRAITLHFARLRQRVAFTWIFDEGYVPNRERDSREHGKGFNRMWRTR